jgi:BirA family biotin operon repressor/biotin-[acetyl-CoA-carboxylase] ligase
VLDVCDSTQDVAAEIVRSEPKLDWPSAVMAREQTRGRGRLQRTWHSASGASLTASLIVRRSSNLGKPWFEAMAVAAQAAQILALTVRWPNDLCWQDRKAGGVLAEVVGGPNGDRYLVIGIGINLRPNAVPGGLRGHAVSVEEATGQTWLAESLLEAILEASESRTVCSEWHDLAPMWLPVDATAGKLFTLPSGEQGIATGIADSGEVVLDCGGHVKTASVAESWMGMEP